MADAVTSVLVKLADILREKVGEVQAVRGQIEQVQKELRLIEALRRDVDSKRTRNNVVTEWLTQVSEIANRIATVIDTFRDKIEENRAEGSNWFTRKFTKAYKNYKTYKLGLHDELEKIIEELDRLYQGRTDLRIEDLGDIDDVDDPEPCDDVEHTSGESHMGIGLLGMDSIVCTGGLGKTTLAQSQTEIPTPALKSGATQKGSSVAAKGGPSPAASTSTIILVCCNGVLMILVVLFMLEVRVNTRTSCSC